MVAVGVVLVVLAAVAWLATHSDAAVCDSLPIGSAVGSGLHCRAVLEVRDGGEAAFVVGVVIVVIGAVRWARNS